MGIIREVRNILDGPYRILEEDNKTKKKSSEVGASFREGESRVVRKLIDLGLARSEKNRADRNQRG